MTHKPFAYFGTPYVARDTLALLMDRGYTPSVVVTAPDARKGRGMERAPSETKAYAEERGLPVLTPERIDTDAIEAIRAYGCEYAIVVAYGKLFPEALLDAFPLGVINIHYSLLPKYRGASPVEAALLHGDTSTGVSVQLMEVKLDAGDVLAQKEVAIGKDETTRELRPRLIEEGAALLADLLPEFEAGALEATPQDASAATHAGKIAKEDGELVLSGDAKENWNKYRAYAERPGTYFYALRGDKRVRVKIRTASFQDGAFTPLRIVPEGKHEMDYADFARG